MAVRIDDVLDYLEEHPIRRCNGSVESVLEMLLEAYSNHNLRDNREIKELF